MDFIGALFKDPLILKALYFGLLGCISAIMTNMGTAVYHDGLRSTVNEVFTGEQTRKEMARFAWSIGAGFIIGFALPFSLITGIVVIHLLLLSTDVIGAYFSNWKLAGLAGFIFGAAVSLIVTTFFGFFSGLPVEISQALSLLWMPVYFSFPLVPVLAIFKHAGVRSGLISLVIIALACAAAVSIPSTLGLAGWLMVSGVALVTGMILSVIFALREKASEASNLEEIYAPNIEKIRKNYLLLLLVAGILAAGASQGWIVGEPVQLVLVLQGARPYAAIVAVLSAIAFIPLIALSGMVSGTWNQDGYPDWILGAGYVLPWAWVAFLGGAIAMGLELLTLKRIVVLLQERPGLSGMGSALRDALNAVPEYALLAGGALAGYALAGPLGLLALVAGYVINDGLGKPVMPVALPPIAVIVLAVGAVLFQ